MKRIFVTLLIILGISMMVPGSALAQTIAQPETTKIDIANLFTWLSTTPIDWGRGALLAGLGLVGALVTIFFLVGGAIPGTVGQVKIDTDTERLERYNKRLDDLTNAANLDCEAVNTLEKLTNNLRDDLRVERRSQFGIAAVLYALLGAFFAAMLARDMLQALVIGAGWTSLIGNLGLKSDFKQRSSEKDKALDSLEGIVKSQIGSGTPTKGANDALDQAKVARML